MTTATATATPVMMWLDLTTRCPLRCVHCYADAGPAGTHGEMTTADWLDAVDQAAALGVRRLTLIGGEPLTHPGCAEITSRALGHGLGVEIFSSLYRMRAQDWDLAGQPGVTLACSYYSDDPVEHDAITTRRGSHARTRANIAEAVRRGIPLRAGLIDLGGQRVQQARADLEALGVTQIRYDRLRAFGRGAAGQPDDADTCGHCGHGAAAVGPDGQVTPCVFTRDCTAGSVRDQPIGDILAGELFADQVRHLDAVRVRPPLRDDPCAPDNDGDICPPCGP